MDRVVNEYFYWLLNFVCDSEEQQLYSELLAHLYNTEFYWIIDLDENRASWGIALRDEFGDRMNITMYERSCLNGPCNMLELLVSLSKQVDNVLYDDAYGERYSKWFWYMINSLGINWTDETFKEGIFNEKMRIFMERKFCMDGSGSLFWLPECNFDCRKVQIWAQKCKFESDFIKNEGL